MRTAPAVTVGVVPDPVWRTCLLVLCVLVGVLLPVWALAQLVAADQTDAFGWLGAVAMSGVSVIAVRALWRLRQLPCHALSWNGQVWQLLDARSQATPVTLSVSIDTGGWLLLRARMKSHPDDPSAALVSSVWRVPFRKARRSVWIALSERSLPQSWHALRCAVHGPMPTATPATTDTTDMRARP